MDFPLDCNDGSHWNSSPRRSSRNCRGISYIPTDNVNFFDSWSLPTVNNPYVERNKKMFFVLRESKSFDETILVEVGFLPKAIQLSQLLQERIPGEYFKVRGEDFQLLWPLSPTKRNFCLDEVPF